jgi:lysyl-tRNA synthetase class 2
MLTPKPTGAAAEPFETYHKALDITLYARIAPELYLKRLMVGGFEKVYELNRNFRNEGLSHKHSPEFTMLEFYCAYMDVNGMMDFCEEMLKKSVLEATGSLKIEYEGNKIDFEKRFKRLPMKDSIVKSKNEFENKIPRSEKDKLESIDWIEDKNYVCNLAEHLKKKINYEYVRKNYVYYAGTNESGELEETDFFDGRLNKDLAEEYEKKELVRYQMAQDYFIGDVFIKDWELRESHFKDNPPSEEDYEKAVVEIFELVVEPNLIQPTFIIDYPKVISPLSKASPENPAIAERFELFIGGIERANGFSELNDPKEQYERFVDQMKERESGDAEAMIMDEDYIKALSYGMPPAAGIGIGIDRIVMLLTNQHSIRDVILFPHMRPEKNTVSDEEE